MVVGVDVVVVVVVADVESQFVYGSNPVYQLLWMLKEY